MKQIIKKILKESSEKKHLFFILKRVDDMLIDHDLKEEFFSEYDDINDMQNAYEFIIEKLVNTFGYTYDESRPIMGAYYETFKDDNVMSTLDDVIIPKQSKYETNYTTFVRGRIEGKMTSDLAYSPQEAIANIKNYEWDDKTITNDETEWDEFDIEFPYKIK
jgi:hypothetical protein